MHDINNSYIAKFLNNVPQQGVSFAWMQTANPLGPIYTELPGVAAHDCLFVLLPPG